MAPRKKKCRLRHPMPVWIPLVRPCLRNMNTPGQPYYMPISPEMYLPPWTLPSSYFKPTCHCTHENHSSAENFRNSTESLNKNPMYCPHSIENDEKLDSHRNGRGQQQNSDDQETSSNSDICSTCAAPIKKQKASTKRNNYQDITAKNVHSRGNEHATEYDSSSEDIVESKKPNTYVNSCCQATNSNERAQNINRPIKDKRLSDPNTDYPEESETSFNRSNKIIATDTCKTAKKDNNDELNCNSCEEENLNSKSNYTQKMGETHNELATNCGLLDQLSHNMSNTRKKQVNKYSGCCLPASPKTCTSDKEMNTMRTPNIKTPYDTKPRRNSRNDCQSSNVPGRASIRSRKINPNERSPQKNSHKRTNSKSYKLVDCECSPTRIQPRKKSEYLVDCECSPTRIQPRKKSEYTVSVSKSKTEACPCKFPPAYQHLSCSGHAACSCKDNTIKKG